MKAEAKLAKADADFTIAPKLSMTSAKITMRRAKIAELQIYLVNQVKILLLLKSPIFNSY